MKLLVLLEVDASLTMIETMQRNGFNLCPDGTAMQIKMDHSPCIPKRKIKMHTFLNPTMLSDELSMIIKDAQK